LRAHRRHVLVPQVELEDRIAGADARAVPQRQVVVGTVTVDAEYAVIKGRVLIDAEPPALHAIHSKHCVPKPPCGAIAAQLQDCYSCGMAVLVKLPGIAMGSTGSLSFVSFGLRASAVRQ
jgi:hypothetical protein